MSTTETSHTSSALKGVSPIGLMVLLFDFVAGDFRRAIAAIDKNDIETRCQKCNHALLVIGQLDSWVDLDKGGEGARNLAGFYAYLRAKMSEAAATQSAKPLEAALQMLVQVRGAWATLDVAPPQEAGTAAAHPVTKPATTESGKKQERITSPQSR